MRSVFQEQPEVAHVYLGSKRHMMERIFNDENEPFWRSARQMELGVIAPAPLRAAIIVEQLRAHRQEDRARAVAAVLETTGGHPYATQELCYFLWEETSKAASPGPPSTSARSRTSSARSTPTSSWSGRRRRRRSD